MVHSKVAYSQLAGGNKQKFHVSALLYKGEQIEKERKKHMRNHLFCNE